MGMNFVQDHIPQWVEKYNPDGFAYTVEDYYDSLHETMIPDVVRGCSMRFGKLIISIQWSDYNYCDHYVGKSYHTVSINPIYKGQFSKVWEAEVAVFYSGSYRYLNPATSPMRQVMIKTPDDDTVWPYINPTEIEDIISTCAAYTRA